jgi:predicted kinase
MRGQRTLANLTPDSNRREQRGPRASGTGTQEKDGRTIRSTLSLAAPRQSKRHRDVVHENRMTSKQDIARHDSRPVDLILMAGYPGVGKSAIALELAIALRYSLLDIDDILTEVDASWDTNDWEKRGRLAYNILKKLVTKQMELGASTIVDTPITHQWLRDFMFSLGDRCNASIHVIHCRCHHALAIKRNECRLAADPERSNGRDVDNFYRVKKLYQPIESIASINIDTARPVGANVAAVLKFLDTARKTGMHNQSLEDIVANRAESSG